MNRLSKVAAKTPIWLVAVLCSVFSLLFLLYSPFQKNFLPDTTVRKLYYVDNMSAAHLRIIRDFNEANRGRIQVVPVNLPFYDFTTNDRKEILTRSLRSRGEGTDIFAVDQIWIPRFAKWAYPLSGAFDRATLADVNEMALKGCYHDDSLVAFPLYLDEGVLYYRKDLIRALPDGADIEKKIRNSMTWDEFIALGGRMRNDHNPFYVFTGGEYEGLLCCFQEMLSEEESAEMFYRSPVNLKTPAAERALRLLTDFVRTYRFSPPEVTRFDEYNSYLYAVAQNAVFLRGWVGYNKQYKEFLRDTSALSNLAIAPLPHFRGHKSSSVFGGWSLMVSKFSNRKEEAVKFIRFMFEKKNQEMLYEEGGYIPINDQVYSDTTYILSHGELAQIRRLLSWGRPRPSLDNYTRISEIMARYLHQTLEGRISLTDALSSASSQINAERVTAK